MNIIDMIFDKLKEYNNLFAVPMVNITFYSDGSGHLSYWNEDKFFGFENIGEFLGSDPQETVKSSGMFDKVSEHWES